MFLVSRIAGVEGRSRGTVDVGNVNGLLFIPLLVTVLTEIKAEEVPEVVLQYWDF